MAFRSLPFVVGNLRMVNAILFVWIRDREHSLFAVKINDERRKCCRIIMIIKSFITMSLCE